MYIYSSLLIIEKGYIRIDMKQFYFTKFIRLFFILLVGFLFASFCPSTQAKKILTGVYGRVYLNSGDSIIADGDLRIKIPKKNEKLEIIRNAYSQNSEIESVIEPASIDSVVIWATTAPERPHTLQYVPDYGWSFVADHSPYVTIYCYATKGYKCAGNGGFWMSGKSKMLVLKDGKILDFGQPDKRMDNKLLTRLEALTADDPEYLAYLRNAKGRCDKILRSLIQYKPSNQYNP